MIASLWLSICVWATVLVFANAELPSSSSDVHVRDVLREKRNTVYKNSTSLDTSWDGAVLFSYTAEATDGQTPAPASVEIICTTCYLKGVATAQFTVDGNLNISQAFSNVTSEIKTEYENITSTTEDYVESYIKSSMSNVEKTGFDLKDFAFPPVDVSFDLEVPTIPTCDLRFQFDGLELYMEIDTILSGGATYTLNLYTSESIVGISVEDLLVGVVFSVDLILSVEAEIDISSGFHIQLHDGIAFDIPMFDQNVSSVTFNGGNFEFLPVTIQSESVALTALLRVGMIAGVEVSTDSPTIAGEALDFSAGIEGGIWADIAQFTTNVTVNPDGSDCELQVIEEYAILLGANAGASVAIEYHTWGPTPSTQVPLWYTTLAEVCAISGSATAAESATATVIVRDDLTTTTTSTEVTYTATVCLSTGLINCPASLQSTSKNTVTKTLITAVPSGSDATFPTTVRNSVVSTIAFGTAAQTITSTSGSPTSYVPTTSATSSSLPSEIGSVVSAEFHRVNNKVAIGVGIGIGLPLLVAIIAASIFFCKRRRAYLAVEKAEPSPQSQHSFESPYTPQYYRFGKQSPRVAVAETPRLDFYPGT